MLIRYVFIFILLLGVKNYSKAKGIILGQEYVISYVFDSLDQKRIIDLAFYLADNYDKVIVHLGKRYPFDKGSMFGTSKSQENLKTFCDFLMIRNIPVYLWLLNSYGSKSFEKIFQEHQEVIDDALLFVRKNDIKHAGWVIDLEWINDPDGDNGDKYIKLLQYFKSRIGSEKKLFAFISLVTTREFNIKRGYYEDLILKYADIIPMLYMADGGFHLNNFRIVPNIRDSRVESLRTYYDSCGYTTAVSMAQGFILKLPGKADFIATINNEDHKVFSGLSLIHIDHHKYYHIRTYKVLENTKISADDGSTVWLKKRRKIHYFEINETILKETDFIWDLGYVEDIFKF